MIKSKGGSAKFSATPTGSRTVSREQSIQRSFGSAGSQGQRGDTTALDDDDDDEIISPPKSRTRAEREAAEAALSPTARAGGAEAGAAGADDDFGEEEEEEDAEAGPQSWQAQFGYTEVEEDDGVYDEWD
jgi:transcription factor IIIB subunit 2